MRSTVSDLRVLLTLSLLPTFEAFGVAVLPSARPLGGVLATRMSSVSTTRSVPEKGSANFVEPETFQQGGCKPGVYVKAGSVLGTKVLPQIKGLRSWEEWYKCPAIPWIDNGHVHTVSARAFSASRQTASSHPLCDHCCGGNSCRVSAPVSDLCQTCAGLQCTLILVCKAVLLSHEMHGADKYTRFFPCPSRCMPPLSPRPACPFASPKILAAKLRKTSSVRYARTLLRTPDGGTIALDIIKSVLPEVPLLPILPAAPCLPLYPVPSPQPPSSPSSAVLAFSPPGAPAPPPHAPPHRAGPGDVIRGRRGQPHRELHVRRRQELSFAGGRSRRRQPGRLREEPGRCCSKP
jgi:hypothetical protein